MDSLGNSFADWIGKSGLMQRKAATTVMASTEMMRKLIVTPADAVFASESEDTSWFTV